MQRPLILRQLPAGSSRQAAGGETRFRAQGRAGAQPGACAATASSTCKVNALARPAGRAAGRQAGRQQSPTASVCAILRLAGLCMPMGRACAGCTGHPAHCPACLSACTTGSLPMRLLRSSEYTACGQGVCMCTGKWQGCYVCVLGSRGQPTLCTGQPRPARGRYTAFMTSPAGRSCLRGLLGARKYKVMHTCPCLACRASSVKLMDSQPGCHSSSPSHRRYRSASLETAPPAPPSLAPGAAALPARLPLLSLLWEAGRPACRVGLAEGSFQDVCQGCTELSAESHGTAPGSCVRLEPPRNDLYCLPLLRRTSRLHIMQHTTQSRKQQAAAGASPELTAAGGRGGHVSSGVGRREVCRRLQPALGQALLHPAVININFCGSGGCRHSFAAAHTAARGVGSCCRCWGTARTGAAARRARPWLQLRRESGDAALAHHHVRDTCSLSGVLQRKR